MTAAVIIMLFVLRSKIRHQATVVRDGYIGAINVLTFVLLAPSGGISYSTRGGISA